MLRIGLKRLFSRAAARTAVPYLAVLATVAWDAIVARNVLHEVRIRATGVAPGYAEYGGGPVK